MLHKKAFQLLAWIKREIEVGEAAAGFDYTRARERTQQLLNLFDRHLEAVDS